MTSDRDLDGHNFSLQQKFALKIMSLDRTQRVGPRFGVSPHKMHAILSCASKCTVHVRTEVVYIQCKKWTPAVLILTQVIMECDRQLRCSSNAARIIFPNAWCPWVTPLKLVTAHSECKQLCGWMPAVLILTHLTQDSNSAYQITWDSIDCSVPNA